MMFDEHEIRKALSVLKPNNEAFEVRLLFDDSRKTVQSGYFRSVDTMIEELQTRDLTNCNVYFSLNHLNDACYDRKQRDHFMNVSGTATSDNDIDGYEWMLIDLDPKRPKGTASTDAQLRLARDMGNAVYKYLQQLGFSKPLLAYSGNGVHLLYCISLANNPDNKALIKRCLEVLSIMFSTDEVGVDTANHNPSRICKLYGTVSTKGLNTPERPHRMSRIIGEPPTDVVPTDRRYLEKLSSAIPYEPERNQHYNGWNSERFDLEAWMDKYGLRYRKTIVGSDVRYILDHCPFDDGHDGKDAAIFRMANGAIGFHCFHNSCADKHWSDVRKLFEPDYQEKQAQAREQAMYGSDGFNRNRAKIKPKHIVEVDDKPIFYTAMDVLNKPYPEEHFIRTGIDEIDRRLRGLKKGAISVVSGLRGSAKSTLVSQWILEAVNAGNNVGLFSGELSERNIMKWVNLQAAGRSHTQATSYEGYYTVPGETRKRIAAWLGDHFYIYNNEYGNDFNAVIEQFEKVIEKNKLDMLVLDNLMAFNIQGLDDNKFEAQSKFVLRLKQIASKYYVHIVFVAHPRKAMGFLRLDDISGNADLSNAADNAFIVHRNNNDFKRLSAQMFGWKPDNEIYDGTNVVEIAKDRDGGNQDIFIPLFYEVESKRLKNDFTENRIYGWDDEFTNTEEGEMVFT